MTSRRPRWDCWKSPAICQIGIPRERSRLPSPTRACAGRARRSDARTDAFCPPHAMVASSPRGAAVLKGERLMRARGGTIMAFEKLAWTAVAVVGGDLIRRRRADPGGAGQRRLARHRRGLHLFHRLPLLRAVHRQPGARRRSEARDAGVSPQRRPRLRADQPIRAVRPSFRGHRRRRARWSARCSRRRWAICRARCGSSPAWCSPARCRT